MPRRPHRRPAPVEWALLAALLAPALGCRALERGPRPVADTREYGAVGFSWGLRGGDDPDPAQDGEAYHVEGGYVVFDGVESKLFGIEGMRASLDLGVTFSRLELEPPLGAEDEADVYRVSLGGRLEWDLERYALTPFLRGGAFARTHGSEDLDVGFYDQDGRGLYGGLGVVWWFAENAGIGPFGTLAYDVGDTDRLESFFGLTVVVRARP